MRSALEARTQLKNRVVSPWRAKLAWFVASSKDVKQGAAEILQLVRVQTLGRVAMRHAYRTTLSCICLINLCRTMDIQPLE
jgi:hypothetical protein